MTRIVLAALLNLAIAGSAVSPAGLAELAAGIRQVHEGDFETAVVMLDGAARKLTGEPARAKDAARAYLYMGVAYQGLGQESIARAKFRQAIRLDRTLRPSADEFSRTAIRSFEAALESVDTTTRTEKEARKKWGKRPFVLIGLGGLATAGLTQYLNDVTSHRDPPVGSVSIAPEGAALIHTTVMTFAWNGPTDRCCSWDLGDGVRPAGQQVAHVYRQEGTFTVLLQVAAGFYEAISFTRSVTVRSLNGRWRFSGPIRGLQEVVFRPLNQRYHAADLVFDDPGLINERFGGGVRTLDPRRLDFRRTVGRNDRDPIYSYFFAGDADATLNSISGQVTCEVDPDQRCASGAVPFTLTRQ